jgi:hypothetical protein
VSATKTTLNSVPGIIPVNNGFGMMYVGRINITLPCGGVYQQIGKIYQDTMWYYHEGLGLEQTSDIYDVLTCQ